MSSFDRVNNFHILIEFQNWNYEKKRQTEKERDDKNQIYTEIKTYKCYYIVLSGFLLFLVKYIYSRDRNMIWDYKDLKNKLKKWNKNFANS